MQGMENNRRRDVLLATVPFSPWRSEGVRRFAREAGWNLLVGSSLMGGICGWRGDGAIVTMRGDQEILALVRRLRRRGVPVVDFTAEHPEIKVPRYCIDNGAVGRLAAEHFVERNFHHAAWFSTDWTPVHATRFNGLAERWGQLVAEGDIPLRWVLREGVPEQRWNDSRAVARWFAGLLHAAPKPLAVFCHGTADAARVVAECRSAGVAVPEEVAVLAAGDDQMTCENQTVPISCLRLDGERQGYGAAALLARLMDGEAPPCEPIAMRPGGIVVRASTDMMAVADPIVAKALAIIASNLSYPWGVAQLCRELGVGPRRLCRHFTAELGRAPGAEILRQRLARAKSLLRDTNLPLAAVAERCGICHAPYLTNLFRRHFGLTPRAWRHVEAMTANT
jgi:LacI family transcriptional regulator